MAEDIKMSVLGNLLATGRTKAAAVGDAATSFVSNLTGSAGSGSSSSSLPSWLVPVVLVTAAALAVWKLAPKLFKKGRRTSRPASRRY